MNPFKTFFDAQRKHVISGGKYEKWYPFYEAIETVFFSLDHVTENSPHVRDSLDAKRFMTIVIITLIPLLFFGIYNAGFQSRMASGLSLNVVSVFLTGLKFVLPLVLVSYVVGFFWEVVFAVIRKHEMSEGLFVTCMLFLLTLPPAIPLWQAALGISFGIVIGKEIFGGTGRNFLNPALTGRAFLFFAYPANMSGNAVWTAVPGTVSTVTDAFSGATPLALAALSNVSEPVETMLVNHGFSFSTLFIGRYPGSIGGTSVLLCLVGAVILTVLGIASYRIILGGIMGVLFTGWMFNLMPGDGFAYTALNPFYHLVLGGFAFGITFMATDPVSSPDMPWAKWAYGFLIGSLTLLIRVYNPAFVEGTMLAILFMNLFAPLMDHIEVRFRLKKRVPNV